MYKVLLDGTLMCDSRIEELALSNPVVKLEEGKVGSFSFVIPPEHPKIDAIKRRKSVIEVIEDEEILFRGICIEVSEDFYKQKTIYCESDLTFFNDTIQRPTRYQGKTVRGLAEAYVSNHNAQADEDKRFTVGMVTVQDENDYISCYTNMESTMACFKADLVDDLGGFLQVRYENGVRYLDYLADSLNTNKQTIKLGKNLIDYTSNIDSTDIATAIIPLGAKLAESSIEGLEERLSIKSVNDGLDYVFDQDAVNSYGWIYKTVTWDDVTTPEALKEKAEKYLAEIQFENVVIEAKALDLHFEDSAVEKFKLSDKIRVVSAPHGLNKYFRLTKLTRNLNNPEKDTITLGKDERLSLTAKSNKENAVIKQEIEKSNNSIMEQAIANATQLITNAMGGYVYKTNEELYIMDTDNPETATRVWRWNINGLGYSSTGINGEYGLAMTMDGAIVADLITAGSMYADRIRGGTLKLGGANNANGVLQVLDASGNVVGKWDKDGITLPSGTKISWENVTNQPTIPSKTSQLTNDSGFETASSIKNTVITKDYIETLNVKAGSVAAENITGTKISGKTIDGGTINGATIKGGSIEVSGATNTTPKIKVVNSATDAYIDICPGAIRYFNADGDTLISILGSLAMMTLTDAAGRKASVSPTSISVEGTVNANNISIKGNATLQNGCTVTGVISATDTISSGGGLNANGGGIYSYGDIYAEGTIATPSWSSASDRKMKQNIEDVEREEALCLLEGISLRKYQFTAEPNVQRIGFIAQEVQEVLSDNNLDGSLFVQHITNPHTEEEHLGLNYLDMCSVLWKGWQILNEEIKELKNEINTLKGVQ